MKAVKIIGSTKSHGKLLHVTVQLEDPDDIKKYRMFLKSEGSLVCPNCKKTHMDIDSAPCVVRVENPLGESLIPMATPIVKCAECTAQIPVSLIDYTAFTSVVAFVQHLKDRYRKKLAEHRVAAS